MFGRLFQSIVGAEPVSQSGAYFEDMIDLVVKMTIEANAVYWGKVQTDEERARLDQQDEEVNRLQVLTRREIVTSLSGPERGDMPYGLLLMSLVKDIERMGDYAKNLAAVPSRTHDDVANRVMPEGEIVSELKRISESIVELAKQAKDVYSRCDQERARQLTSEGREVAKRCEALVDAIARSDLSARMAVDLALATRFYKRIQGHLLNLLSAVIMPLDKLDSYERNSERPVAS